MKKIVSLILCLIFCATTVFANENYLYTESTKESVTGGITYEQKTILTKNGWIKAYVAYVDIDNPNTDIKVMTAKNGSSYLENVKSMAQRENAAVAINADFFNTGSSQTNMLGMVYKDGEIISSPAKDNQASFVITKDNEVIMDYFSFDITLFSPQGYSCPVYQINKVPVTGGGITILTPAWANKTWGNGLKEMIVEDDKVKEIREATSDATDMPSNGYVVVTNPEVNGFLDNFSIGDEVVLETTVKPDINNIKEATGGNTLIVENGKLAKFTGNVTGYAQRSSIGVTKDGKTVILATTDGRKTDCRGLTQTEMAYLMISLGAEKAINLDGGGSATLVKKEVTGKLETQNDVSSLRNVSTAIGAFDKGVRGKTAKSGEITSDKNVVLPHQSVNLSAVFYDEYGNRLQDDSAVTKFYDANGNTLSGGVFTPTSNGKYTLYAACHDIVCSTIITVSDKINSIDITNGEFIEIAEGKSKDLDCVIYDTEGNKIIPDKSLIKWSSDNSNVTVKNGTVYVKSKDGAIISASFDGKTDYICINQKPHEKRAPFATQVKDNFNTEILSDIKIAISGEVPKGATLLNRYYSLERLNTINKYHKAYVTKNYYKDLLGSNTTEASSYTVYNIEGTTFATLSTSEGYVKNASEWVNLYTATTGSNKNLVIITEKSPLELPEEEETRIKSFFDNATKNGKNVFYVYSGDVPRVDIENGVRYISLGRVGSYLTSNMNDNKAYCTYLEFYVKGNEIGYNFIS